MVRDTIYVEYAIVWQGQRTMTDAGAWNDDEIASRLEKMDNKLERIKSSVHNLNRIASMKDDNFIIGKVMEAIGDSPYRAAILLLTKEKISRQELADELGIDPRNLNKFMNAFLDNREYVNQLSEGNKTYYQRVELIDLIGLERDSRFIELVSSWRAKKAAPSSDNPTQ